MKELQFILKRISQTALADMVGIKKSNITLWKLLKRVPLKHREKLREIKKAVAYVEQK